MIWVALQGASVALGKRQHLGVDNFVKKLDPSAQKLVASILHSVDIFFAFAIFIRGGWQLVSEVIAVKQQMNLLPISKVWVYAVLPITVVFTHLFASEQLCQLFTTKGKEQ